MLQIAYGGYYLSETETYGIEDFLVFHEPGYISMSPLEIVISKCDQFYFILRKRTDVYGDTFENLNHYNFSVTVTDPTINESIENFITPLSSDSPYFHSEWADTPYSTDDDKLVVTINCGIPIDSPFNRVRILDCSIKDNTDNSVLFFRVTIEDSRLLFYYIPVDTNKIDERESSSYAGYLAIVSLEEQSTPYLLVSPFAYLREVSSTETSDFSYPMDAIYYQRQTTYNEENFSFSITKYSHAFLEENLSLFNVPGYSKVGVILIDKNLYQEISALGMAEVFIDVTVTGELSGISDSFRVYFVKSN